MLVRFHSVRVLVSNLIKSIIIIFFYITIGTNQRLFLIRLQRKNFCRLWILDIESPGKCQQQQQQKQFMIMFNSGWKMCHNSDGISNYNLNSTDFTIRTKRLNQHNNSVSIESVDFVNHFSSYVNRWASIFLNLWLTSVNSSKTSNLLLKL